MTRPNGKTALITGSTDGVGRLVAKRLGEAGARVLVHGRDRERGERVVAEIKEGGASADFLAADLSALAEVHRLAEAVQQRTDQLDILINNAGIGTGGSGAPRQTSADGHELRFAVNYLAGFLLTRLLVPLLEQSAAEKVPPEPGTTTFAFPAALVDFEVEQLRYRGAVEILGEATFSRK